MDNQNLNFNLNARNYQPKYNPNQQNQYNDQQSYQQQNYQLNNYQQQYYQYNQQPNRNYSGYNDQYSNYYYGNYPNNNNQQNYYQNYDQQYMNQQNYPQNVYYQNQQSEKYSENKFSQPSNSNRSTAQTNPSSYNKPYEVEVINDYSNSYQGNYNKKGRGKSRGGRGRGRGGAYNNANNWNQNQNQSQNQYQEQNDYEDYQDNYSQSTNNHSISKESKGYSNFEEFEKYDKGNEYGDLGEYDELNDVFGDEFENYAEADLHNDDKFEGGDEYYEDDLGYEFEKKTNLRESGRNYETKNDLIFSNKLGFTEFVNKSLNRSKKFPSDSFLNVLMIAEKPSIAQAISYAIAKGNTKSFGKRGVKTFVFDGYFKDIKARFTVTSVMGHVMTTDFQSTHNKWDSVDPIQLFDVDILKLDANPKARLGLHLRNAGKGKDIICLWLDCDKEGENICYETLHYAFPLMNRKPYQQIYRAKFSSLTNNDLRSAFNNISELPNAFESLSVDARQLIDLKIGVSFTRFLTSNIFPLLKNLEDPNLKLLSYGPCQTPTLYFCVKRHYEIANFQSKEYYKPYVEVEISRLRYKIFHGSKFWEKTPVQTMVQKLRPNKQATVTNVEVVKKNKQAPAGLNTVALLRVASSYLKMSPMDALHKAEKLYSMGYTTYPRTETTKYASGFDFSKILSEFSAHKQFGGIASKLCKNFCKPHRGNDAGDHPPITPTTKVASKESLNPDLWRLYEFICTHFFASLSEAAEYEEKVFTVTVDKENFSQDSMLLTHEGFLSLMPWKRGNYVKNFPNLTLNQVLKVDSISYEIKETEPPEYLSESDLIKMMEQNKIGTDASMPTHIENITERRYVNVNSNRRLIPTKLGIALIEALTGVDSDLVVPTIRANIEKNVDEIAKGTKTYEEVLKYSIDLFRNKFSLIRKNYDRLVAVFRKYFSLDQNILLNNVKKINMKNQEYSTKVTKTVDVTKITTDLKQCNYCKNGKLWLSYDEFDKHILRCTSCNIRKKVLRDTIEFNVVRDKQCEKCKSYFIFVTVENPFKNGDCTYEGCMFCDPNLS